MRLKIVPVLYLRPEMEGLDSRSSRICVAVTARSPSYRLIVACFRSATRHRVSNSLLTPSRLPGNLADSWATLSGIRSLTFLIISMDNFVPFCFRIRGLRPDYNQQHLHTYANGYWKPPTRKNAYTETYNTGWRLWSPSSCSPIPTGHAIQIYDRISMFYASDRQAFLLVPYDCTRESVRSNVQQKGPLMDWRKLRFDYVSMGNGHCISRVGDNLQNQILGATHTEGWVPELVPRAYRNESTDEPEYLSTSLGGSLAIILALAAFSRNPSTMSIVETIRDHFRPTGNDGWELHYTPEEHNARK